MAKATEMARSIGIGGIFAFRLSFDVNSGDETTQRIWFYCNAGFIGQAEGAD